MQTGTSYWVAGCGNTAASTFVNGALVNMQFNPSSSQWFAAYTGLVAGEIGFRAITGKVVQGVFTLYLISEPPIAGTTFLSRIYTFNTLTNSFASPAFAVSINLNLLRGLAFAPYNPAQNPTPSQAGTPSTTPSAPATASVTASTSFGVSPPPTPSNPATPTATATPPSAPDANNLFAVRIGNATSGTVVWNSNVAVPVYVDEIIPTSGALYRSIALPTVQARLHARAIAS
jgi:hypothetical protein